jgi:hypothetical protein
MRRKFEDISHKLLTNNLFIIGGAFGLFVLINALLGHWKVEPMVIGPMWI